MINIYIDMIYYSILEKENGEIITAFNNSSCLIGETSTYSTTNKYLCFQSVK